jgi:glycosyltransferase involved in cell wall biosynthesis
VFLPEGVTPDRGRFGLPDSAFVCLTVMDAGSGFERKNPLASVAAFREAFAGLGPDDVRLVVKMTGRRDARAYSAQIQALHDASTGDPRITIVEESMTYADVLALNASADVLVSLHRSEGLGLNLMEAMSLGTVVVATGWSGNMDFTTHENSIVVSGSATEVRSSNTAYTPRAIGEGQYWMEPDVHEAAAGLRRLYDDRDLLDRLAARAREDMDAARAAFLEGAWLSEVRELYDSGEIASERHALRSERFRRVMRVSAAERAAYHAKNVLRPIKRATERVLRRER